MNEGYENEVDEADEIKSHIEDPQRTSMNFEPRDRNPSFIPSDSDDDDIVNFDRNRYRCCNHNNNNIIYKYREVFLIRNTL